MTISVEYIHDNQTGQTIVIDNRIFFRCVENQLQTIREYAKELILASAPEYKQRNAALGLLSDAEANAIRAHIESIRTISNQKEAEILAVIWDGQESTRAAACDAVQNVRWD
jgi:hypothetical protein